MPFKTPQNSRNPWFLNNSTKNFVSLEVATGKDTSDALLQLLEFKMSDFKAHIDHKFDSFEHKLVSIEKRFSAVQWLTGLGFTLIAFLIALSKFLS